MTSLPVLGAVFCHPSGVYHHLQSRVVGLPFVIIKRNTAPNVLCPRPSCDARLSLELEANNPSPHELGSMEICANSIVHSPNGRFVNVVGIVPMPTSWKLRPTEE